MSVNIVRSINRIREPNADIGTHVGFVIRCDMSDSILWPIYSFQSPSIIASGRILHIFSKLFNARLVFPSVGFQ